MSKFIPLSNGQVSVVDDIDAGKVLFKFERIKYQKNSFMVWHSKKHGNTFYATACIKKDGRWRHIRMHRLILGLLNNTDIVVDHKNGDGLDNRRENLRMCSQRENVFNSKKYVKSYSKFKGVTWNKYSKKWIAQIMFKRRNFYLGAFDDQRKAAIAYDQKAKELFGEYASLNVY